MFLTSRMRHSGGTVPESHRVPEPQGVPSLAFQERAACHQWPTLGLMQDLVMTLRCPDRPGIVHALTGAVVAVGGNITECQ